jgi:hypothetical protein
MVLKLNMWISLVFLDVNLKAETISDSQILIIEHLP